MKNQPNDSGYALVTVLLIITIFSILALSFAGQAFNSSKQHKVVEAKAQSVALAEMGVEYFKVAVQNAYISSQTAVKDAVTGKMNEDRELFYSKEENKDKEWVPIEDDYLTYATSQLTNTLHDALEPLSKKVVIKNENGHHTGFHFEITSETEGQFTKEDGHSVIIAFQSNGYESIKNTDPATLRATLTIEIDDLEFFVGSGNGNDEGELKLPDFKMIAEPTNVEDKCKNKSTINCKINLLENGGAIEDNNNKMINKTIYSKGNLTFSGTANNMNNVRIHAEGDLEAGKNMNGAQYSIIEVNESATFGSQLRFSNSKLLVRKDATIDGHLNVEDGSFVYIGGDLSYC